MSINYQLPPSQLLWPLTGARPFRWLDSGSIPLAHFRERPRAKSKNAG
ncbi:hypothetical protein GGD66_002490 [Bradyrhizobium sp. CIR48]|nr:hypothetical protein [Bradyrhizobium sp. CIR48]MBB4423946.1 hypothetical protein [Bradyrhizobium sp. CIR48]